MQLANAGFSRSTFVVRDNASMTGIKDKYDVGELLGEGATAKVYRAVNKRTKMEVAVKVISKELVPDENMLRNEIEIHKATDHPNILRLLSTYEDDHFLYLVTELCEGGDLRQSVMAQRDEYSVLQMKEEDALALFRQVVASVRYLHKMGIVHRDLKPQNFLVAASTRASGSSSGPGVPVPSRMIIKLTDFGVSTFGGLKHRLTRRVGTDGFMAPEVLKCKPYNEKADIFSAGCILHTLLTGNPPKRLEDGSYRLDNMRLRYVSDEMRAFIASLTQAQPEDRPSVEEVACHPFLLASKRRLREASTRSTSTLLDQMYAYGAFPLLKKAALIAMVSRAESDVDFLPSVEKFMSFGSHRSMNYAIGATDLYSALLEELATEMDVGVRRALGRRRASARGSSERRALAGAGAGASSFKRRLRENVEQLLRKIDCDASGNISYSEWLAATVTEGWYADPVRIGRVFQLFDADGDGVISEEDLKSVLPRVFRDGTVEAVLQESQLSARSSSWLSEAHFSALMRTRSYSAFTLRRIADGFEEPLSIDASGEAAGRA